MAWKARTTAGWPARFGDSVGRCLPRQLGGPLQDGKESRRPLPNCPDRLAFRGACQPGQPKAPAWNACQTVENSQGRSGKAAGSWSGFLALIALRRYSEGAEVACSGSPRLPRSGWSTGSATSKSPQGRIRRVAAAGSPGGQESLAYAPVSAAVSEYPWPSEEGPRELGEVSLGPLLVGIPDVPFRHNLPGTGHAGCELGPTGARPAWAASSAASSDSCVDMGRSRGLRRTRHVGPPAVHQVESLV